jgi:O-antigen chain-terminating methyltransferase
MVERVKKKSLKAVHGEALSYLQAADSQSYGAITGFHFVEHVPFNVLLRIFNAAHRALVAGGFVIFETPNPENLKVGSDTFYIDPSHLRPLPPELLTFALETCGFKNVEIKRLHPDIRKDLDNLTPEVTKLLFGARDYAVIGYK